MSEERVVPNLDTNPKPSPARTVSGRAARGRVLSSLGALSLVVLFLIAGVSWVVASPVGSSPDDDYHQTTIWCHTAGPDSVCETGYLIDGSPVVKTYTALQKPCFATHPTRSAACQVINADESFTNRIDAGAYPGWYYKVLQPFASDRIVASILLMRALNLTVFIIGVGLVCWLSAAPVRRALLLTLAVTMVPVGLFLITSVNPSSWAVTGIAVQFFSMLGLDSASTRARELALGFLVAFGAALASMARGDAGAYAVVVSLLGVLLLWPGLRVRPLRWLALLPPVIFGTVSFLSSRQTSVYGESTLTTDYAAFNLLDLLKIPLGNLGLGSMGELGWLDTPMPAATWALMALTLGAILVPGVTTLGRTRAVAMALPALLTLLLPLYLLQKYGYRIGAFVQPRYVLPLLVVVVGIAVFRRSHEPALVSRATAVLLASLVAAANAAALYSNLMRYTNGSEKFALGYDTEWWWWNSEKAPLLVWAAGAITFAVALIAAAFVVMRAEPNRLDGASRFGIGAAS